MNLYAAPKVIKQTLKQLHESLADWGKGDIHVWCLDLRGDVFDDQGRVLIEADFVRGSKFVFERDRTRFLRARYCVRNILGAYLSIDPMSLDILIGEHGKPFISPKYGIAFNLSHSDHFGVLAVGPVNSFANHIGIDIEALNLPVNVRQVAQSVFSPAECHAFADIADDSLELPFFTCWTRKEAFLKAIGAGFTIEAKSITVGIEPMRQEVEFEFEFEGEQSTAAIHVSTILQKDDYVVSIAILGGYDNVKIFDYVAL